jgi:hypothetical protein
MPQLPSIPQHPNRSSGSVKAAPQSTTGAGKTDVDEQSAHESGASSGAASYYLKLLKDMTANPTVIAALASALSPALKREVISYGVSLAGKEAAAAAQAKSVAEKRTAARNQLHAAGDVIGGLGQPAAAGVPSRAPHTASSEAAAARSGFMGRRYSDAAAAAREAAEATALAAAVAKAAASKAIAAAIADAEERERSRLARLLQATATAPRRPADADFAFSEPRIGAGLGLGVTFKVVPSKAGPVVQGVAAAPLPKRSYGGATLSPMRPQHHGSSFDSHESDDASADDGSSVVGGGVPAARPGVESLMRAAGAGLSGDADSTSSQESLVLLRKDPSGQWEADPAADFHFSAAIPALTKAAQTAVAVGKAMTGQSTTVHVAPSGNAKGNEVRMPKSTSTGRRPWF